VDHGFNCAWTTIAHTHGHHAKIYTRVCSCNWTVLYIRFKYDTCIATATCSQVWQGTHWMQPTLIAPLAHNSTKDYLRLPDQPTLLESEALPPSVSLQETRFCQLLSQHCYYSFLTWHQEKSLIQLLKFISQPCTTCTLLLACTDLSRNNLPQTKENSGYLYTLQNPTTHYSPDYEWHQRISL